MPETKSLFNRVAEHYDLLNTILSFGMDRSWRKKLAEVISSQNYVLDIAAGTAEVAIQIVKRWNKSYAIGIDPSKQMLDLAHEKLEAAGVKKKIALVMGLAENLPFKEDTFNAVTIAFGIRNTVDPLTSMKEICRVLRPGGKVGILEFAVPQNKIFALLYMSYIRKMFPFLGSFFGKRNEYQYLVDSIPMFPQRDSFTKLMEDAGFTVKKPIELTLGTVIIYVGIKGD